MRLGITFSKISFILFALALFRIFGTDGAESGTAMVFLFAGFISFGIWLFLLLILCVPGLKMMQSGVGIYFNPESILLFSLLCFLFYFRLSSQAIERSPAPPEKWYNWSKSNIQKVVRPRGFRSNQKFRKTHNFQKNYKFRRNYKVRRIQIYLWAETKIEKALSRGLYLATVVISSKNPDEKFPFTTALRINDDSLYPGCRLKLKLSGRAIPVRLNESSFHEYLRRKGAQSYLSVSKSYHVKKTACEEPDFRTAVKQKIRTILKNRFSKTDNSAGIAEGLLFGESYRAGYLFKKNAKKLGILHLFAASGLHMAIFYGCLYLPLSLLLGKRHPIAVFLPLLPSIFYLWILDFPVSFTRAVIFVFFFALKSVIHRRLPISEFMINASLLTIFIMPAEFVSLSGALSFGAVCGILFFFETIRREIFNFRGRGLSAAASQAAMGVSASLFTGPLLLYAFRAYSFSGIPINFFMVPSVSLLLPVLYSAVALELAAGETIFIYPLWFLLENGFLLFQAATDWLSKYSLYSDQKLVFYFILPVQVLFFTAIFLLSFRHGRFSGSPFVHRIRPLYRKIRAITFFLFLLLLPPGAAVLDLYHIYLESKILLFRA